MNTSKRMKKLTVWRVVLIILSFIQLCILSAWVFLRVLKRSPGVCPAQLIVAWILSAIALYTTVRTNRLNLQRR